ncbi:BnaC02g46090D [Brassica napus]|uniref:BnaC02g46090D protein n=1 Tax=Brassica napus TaxID=3708 RepID=A0A078JC42_BRANA|nr:BnaC02g46090D [Brassica napus]
MSPPSKTSLTRKQTSFKSHRLNFRRKSQVVEAKLEIQHLKSEHASLELLLQEKDEELTEARNQLEEVNREVKELKMLMASREDELGSSKLQASEAEMGVERIAELTSRLVQDQMQQQPLEKQPYGDYGMEKKRLVMELNFTIENPRLKEMEVLAA